MATLWDDVRGDFPGLAGKVYLNAAATSLTPRPVREAVTSFYRELEEGGDRHWDAWLERREAARGKVARLVGAEPEEIAFVPNLPKTRSGKIMRRVLKARAQGMPEGDVSTLEE